MISRFYRDGDAQIVDKYMSIKYIDATVINQISLDNPLTSFTIEKDGVPTVCAGAHLMWEGCYHLWAMIPDNLKFKPISIIKEFKRLMQESVDYAGVKIYCSFVQESIPKNIKMVKALGMKEEFRIPKSAPDGADMVGFVLRMS